MKRGLEGCHWKPISAVTTFIPAASYEYQVLYSGQDSYTAVSESTVQVASTANQKMIMTGMAIGMNWTGFAAE
jgi:hypothetical protein